MKLISGHTVTPVPRPGLNTRNSDVHALQFPQQLPARWQ